MLKQTDLLKISIWFILLGAAILSFMSCSRMTKIEQVHYLQVPEEVKITITSTATCHHAEGQADNIVACDSQNSSSNSSDSTAQEIK